MNKIILIGIFGVLISCNKGIYIEKVYAHKVESVFSISMRLCNKSSKVEEYSLLSSRENGGVLPNKFYSISNDSVLIFKLSSQDVDGYFTTNIKDDGFTEVGISILKLKKNECVIDSINIEIGEKSFKDIKILFDDKIINKSVK